MVREIMEARQKYIDKLLIDYDTYHDDLSDLEVVIHKLLEQIHEYRSYIDEHVLWIRSVPAFSRASASELGSSAREMLDTRRGLLAVPGVVVARAKSRPLYAIALVMGLVTLFVIRHLAGATYRIRGGHRIQNGVVDGDAAHRPGRACLTRVRLRCGSWPCGCETRQGRASAKWWLRRLQATAVAWFVAAALVGGFRRHGIAEGLLGFGEASTKVVRRQLSVFQSLIVPLVFPLAWLAATRDPRSGAVLERVLFITIQLMLAYLLHRLLRPSSGVLANVLVRLPTSWPSRLRTVWYLLGIGFPITLGGADVSWILLHSLAAIAARSVYRSHDGDCQHVVRGRNATAPRTTGRGAAANRGRGVDGGSF